MAFRGNSTSAHPVNQNRAPIEPASQEFEKRTTRKVYNFKPSLPEETTNAQTDLIGYEAEPEKILAKIAELQSQLGERDRRNGNPVAGVLPRRAIAAFECRRPEDNRGGAEETLGCVPQEAKGGVVLP